MTLVHLTWNIFLASLINSFRKSRNKTQVWILVEKIVNSTLGEGVHLLLHRLGIIWDKQVWLLCGHSHALTHGGRNTHTAHMQRPGDMVLWFYALLTVSAMRVWTPRGHWALHCHPLFLGFESPHTRWSRSSGWKLQLEIEKRECGAGAMQDSGFSRHNTVHPCCCQARIKYACNTCNRCVSGLSWGSFSMEIPLCPVTVCLGLCCPFTSVILQISFLQFRHIHFIRHGLGE